MGVCGRKLIDLYPLPISLRSPLSSQLKPILAIVIVLNGLVNLSLRVHHKRAMLNHRLVERLTTNQDEPQWLGGLVPHTQPLPWPQDQDVVSRHRGRIRNSENTLALNYVHESVPRFWDGLMIMGTWFEGEIQVHCWSLSVNRGVNPHRFPCYDFNFDPVAFCIRDVFF